MFTITNCKKEMDFLLTNIDVRNPNDLSRKIQIKQIRDEVEMRSISYGTEVIITLPAWSVENGLRSPATEITEICGTIRKSDLRGVNEVKVENAFLNGQYVSTVSWNGQYVSTASYKLFPKRISLRQIQVLPNEIIETIIRAQAFASDDEMKPALCGIHIYSRGSIDSDKHDEIVLESSNGHFLYRRIIKKKIRKAFNFIFSKRDAKLLVKMLKIGEIDKVLLMKNGAGRPYIEVICGNQILKSGLVYERFPDCDSIIPSTVNMNVVHFDTAEMFVVVTDIKKNAPEGSPEGTVIINGDGFNVPSSVDDEEIWKVRSPIHFPIRMGLNINLLWTIIRNIALYDKKARWFFPKNPDLPIVFLTENDGEIYLLMPIRLSE